MDEHHEKVVLDAMTKWVKAGVRILIERRVDRSDPALVKEALRDSWEEMVLEVLKEFDKPLAVFIWITSPPAKKETITRGKDYSLEAYERRVSAQLERVS